MGRGRGERDTHREREKVEMETRSWAGLGWAGKLGMGGDRGDWTKKKASLCSGMQQIEVHSSFRALPFLSYSFPLAPPGAPYHIDYECTRCGRQANEMPLQSCTPCPVAHRTTSLPNTYLRRYEVPRSCISLSWCGPLLVSKIEHASFGDYPRGL